MRNLNGLIFVLFLLLSCVNTESVSFRKPKAKQREKQKNKHDDEHDKRNFQLKASSLTPGK